VGSIGVTGDPEKSEPVTRLASGLIAKEFQEREILDLLLGHAAQMDKSIIEIVNTVALADSSQRNVAAEVDDVERLVEDSFEDIKIVSKSGSRDPSAGAGRRGRAQPDLRS